jgi:hypothetical protein
MRPGWNPLRRNRNIGTSRQGQGKNNRMVIPWRGRSFSEHLIGYRAVTRPVGGQSVTILVEPTRLDCVHCCTVDDVFRMLGRVPGADLEGLALVILRQPRRKEQILSPAWGRLRYSVEIGHHRGPAVILEAISLAARCRWPRSLTPDEQDELERLRADGHVIEATRRGYLIHSSLDSARATQLYRTLPHEIGHWCDYLRSVERPARLTPCSFADLLERYHHKPRAEKEVFAHRYADLLRLSLQEHGRIPFARVLDVRSLHRDGLSEADFALT